MKWFYFYGEFMVMNIVMKFIFVVFMGYEMFFMGFLLDIYGIFIKLCFIV